MGLSSTLYTGISGLKANSEAMSVTGNNISNSNTIGFKSSNTLFSDALSASISSSSGAAQVGRGTQISTVKTTFSQGSFQKSSSATDLAIEGKGFFMLSPSSSSEILYSRNGSFSFDSDGYLISADKYRVQGKGFDINGNLQGGDPGDIKVDLTSQSPARQTSTLSLQTNLDSGSSLVGPFNISNAKGTSNYSTSTQIFDSLGNTHTATTYFTKTGPQTWTWNTVVNSSELTSAAASSTPLTLIGSGTLTFDDQGKLQSGGTATTNNNALAWKNGANSGQRISMNFNTTQFSSSSVVISQKQNGYAPGQVTQLSIDNKGTVIASYSNGIKKNIARLTLATFTNTEGLEKAGGSTYKSTTKSGPASVGVAGSSQGKIFTNSLELSNVDLAQEFVKLITIQNGYSASSKVITTTDEMLKELINLKR